MIRPDPRREDGLTVPELMVTALIGMIVCLGLFTFLDNTSESSERTAARVDAAKVGRPVMAAIMDRLHSTCVAPDVAPILTGSTDRSISFINQTGSAVSPEPVKRTITFDQTAGTLTETVYPVSSGAAPSWTFSTTPTVGYPRLMLKQVVPAQLGSPSVAVPVFRYYAFDATGVISTTPLPVPLSATNAAKTVQVTVSFAVAPRSAPITTDLEGDETDFSSTAIFRFTPPGESASTENLPCA
jgi:hypothetical protein